MKKRRVSQGRAKSILWSRWTRAAVLALLASIWAAELFFRARYGEQLKIHVRPQIYLIDERLGYRYRPGARTRICVPSICKDIQINSNGYYGPPFEREKQPGVYRVAIVAASEGSGIWLQGERAFPVVMQQHFDDAGRRVEVLNFSVDGSHRGLANLRLIVDEVLDYGPDLIAMSLSIPLLAASAMRENYRGYVIYPGVTGMTAAAIEANRAAIRKYIDGIEDAWLSMLYTASYTVRAAHRRALRLGGTHSKFPKPTWQSDLLAFQTKRVDNHLGVGVMSFASSLRELEFAARLTSRAGAKLVPFVYESAVELKGQLAERGLPLVQLQIPAELYVHAHDGHYNPLGHELVGRKLFQAIGTIMDEADQPVSHLSGSAFGPLPVPFLERPSGGR